MTAAAHESLTAPRTSPEIRSVPLSALRSAPYNPRRISPAAFKALTASLERFGYVEPIVWNQRSGFVIGGHQRLKVLRRQKRREVPVVVVDLDDPDEKALNVALNSPTLAGEFTSDLTALLDEIAASRATLYADLRLDELRAQIPVNRPTTGDVDEIPPVPKSPITKPGEIWTLGRHRLVCGDASDPTVWRSLLGERRANLVVTSPPYASQRRYDAASGFTPVPADAYVAWFQPIAERIAANLAADGSFFLNLRAHCEAGERVPYVYDLVLHLRRVLGWRFVDDFVWTHGGTPKAVVGRFKNGWEPVFQFTRGEHKFRPEAVRHESADVPDWSGAHPSQQDGRAMHKGRAKDDYRRGREDPAHHSPGLAYPSNVLDAIGKNLESVEHGAVYPVALPEFFIRAYSDRGDAVVDPFAGAGTTLMAAEVNQRDGFAIEISPAYCDLILERWQAFTGAKHSVPDSKTPKESPRRRGRPTIWTAELEDAFFRTLGTGCSLVDAGISCGLDKNLIMRRQRDDVAFRERVEKARVDFKIGSLAIIAKAATHTWTAAAWYIERVYPHEFGRSRVEVSGPDDRPVEIDFSYANRVGTDPQARAAHYLWMALCVGDQLRPEEAEHLESVLAKHRCQRATPSSDQETSAPGAPLVHPRDDEREE